MPYVWAAVLVVGGAALSVYAWKGVHSRPGWDRPFGVGALLLTVGGFLVLGGLLNAFLALRS